MRVGQQGGAETARCRFKVAGREGEWGRLRHAAWPGGSEERGVKTAPTSGPGRSASGRGGGGGCPARLAGLARLLGRAAGARGWAGGWRAERGRGRGE